jgi:hypothetical protein
MQFAADGAFDGGNALRTTLRLIATLLFIAVASRVASAQNAMDEFVSDNCHTALSAGTGVASTRICISSTGNVTKFEAGGVEHLAVRHVLEGYQVCMGIRGPNDIGDPFDMGVWEWLFEAPSISQPNGRNTVPLVITRKSIAGPIRLVQEFTTRTRPYGPTELIIKMQVYNTGTVTLPEVMIWRFFDGDVNGDYNDDQAIRTAHSATVVDFNGTPKSLTLTAGILDKTHVAGITDPSSIETEAQQSFGSTCRSQSFGQDPLVEQIGDHAGEVTYEVGDILPGRVKTVEFIYRVQ